MSNDMHAKSNELISQAAELAGGFPVGESRNGRKIFRVVIETVSPGKLRAICYGKEDDPSILEIAESGDYQTLRQYLASEFKIGLMYTDFVMQETKTREENKGMHAKSNDVIAAAFARGEFETKNLAPSTEAADVTGMPKKGMHARMLENEACNETEKAKSPGMISQFEADGLMYSIVHNPAYILTVVGGENRINQEFYTAYVQNSSIEDPDEGLVTTESFDTLIEAVMYIRSHIEGRLFNAFMPALLTKTEIALNDRSEICER